MGILTTEISTTYLTYQEVFAMTCFRLMYRTSNIEKPLPNSRETRTRLAKIFQNETSFIYYLEIEASGHIAERIMVGVDPRLELVTHRVVDRRDVSKPAIGDLISVFFLSEGRPEHIRTEDRTVWPTDVYDTER